MCEKSDCKREKDLGWLCDQCQRSLISQGVPLEMLEESLTEEDNVEVKDDKVITKIDDDTTLEKEFDSPLQAQVATAAVAQGKADPKVLVPEDTQTEKLYSKPSEPSDGYEKEPLKDAEENILVTLKDIDWDIEKILADLDQGEDAEEVISALPDPWTIRLNSVELNSDDIKSEILKAANEQAPWAIKNATIDKVEDADLGGIYYSADSENKVNDQAAKDLVAQISDVVYTELEGDTSEQAELIRNVMNQLLNWYDAVGVTDQQFATALMYVLNGLNLNPEYKEIYERVEQIADNAPNAVFPPALTQYEKDSSN